MRFEADDAADRRYTGVVTGVAELDPVRWPGSKWRSLMVRWDDAEINHHGRVSPWDVERTGSFPSPSHHLMTSGLKRNRIGLPLTKPDFPIPGGMGVSDFGESLGFQKVLQGQENLGFHSAYDGYDNPNHSVSHPRRYFPSSIPPDDYGRSTKGVTFGESFQFQKVLQGRETHLSPSHINRTHEIYPSKVFEGVQVSSYGNGNRSGNGWRKGPSNSDSLTQVSSPSSVLMFQQANIQHRMMNNMDHKNYNNVPSYTAPTKRNDEVPPRGKTSCRLFGFSLTEGEHRVGPKRKLGSFPPPLYHETRFWPLVEGRPCYKSSPVTKAVRSNCPDGNDLYSVRDMLLDIAL